MNANTRLRLWKETRALLPFWAVVAGLMVLPRLALDRNPLNFSMPAYWFGCALLGAASFGLEFQSRSVGLLLTQPTSRRRLWWEKMAVLTVAEFALLILIAALWFSDRDTRMDFGHEHWRWLLLLEVAPFIYAAVIGFTTGPVLTLLTRSILGGATLTLFCPWALFFIGTLLLPGSAIRYMGSVFAVINVTFVGGIYCGALFLFGCRRFQRLEDANYSAPEISLPPSMTESSAWFAGRFGLSSGGALWHLFCKEVRLHLPAFVVAGMLAGLWLLLLAVVFTRPTVSKDFLLLPVVLLGLGIPVIAGIVSTAEERSLGLLDWHLTLPVSARRQWFVKVLVALAVNVVLGILLPGVLAQASGGLLEGPSLELGVHNGGQHFLIANAVIFCAALYASTVSANSMRALVGSIVLFLAGAMILNFADYVRRLYPEYSTGPSSRHLLGDPGLLWPFDKYRWILGWSSLAVWLYFLGLAGFRRSLESFWRPVRRMAVFFAVVCAFVFAAIVW